MRPPLAFLLGLMALAAPLGTAAADPGQPLGQPLGVAPAATASAAPCPTVALPALHLPATRTALRTGKPITILAFGSSSTEGSGATTPDRTYPARLAERLRAALPGVPVEVLNRGRGGEDVGEMLARLDREVVAARPTVVIWQAGANAVMKGMDPEAFRTLMAEGIARLQATGADVVLMDSQRAPRILASPNHALFESLMQQLSEAAQVPLFSRAELMRRWEAAGEPPGRLIGEDGLHHNDRGYDCVAAALSRALATALRPSSTPQMASALMP